MRERAEELRSLRVGIKDVSEQAAIVSRYADLFTEDQLDALREAEDGERETNEKERLHRLRRTCETGLVIAALAPSSDALQTAELASRVEFEGESIPLRSAIARSGALPGYAEREELGKRAMDASAELNGLRLDNTRAREVLRASTSGEPDPVVRSEVEKGISLRDLANAVARATSQTSNAYDDLCRKWCDRLLGPDRAPQPASYHAAYMARLGVLEDSYPKERATEVCVQSLIDLGFDLKGDRHIQLDLEDRPQKSPRPVVIPADPPSVVYLITRPRGGLQDYASLMHEAGHALHFAGCDLELPYAFRRLSRDNALSEVYSYLLQAITREPEWHARHFPLTSAEAEDNAQATRFLHAFVVRRNVAKLHFELDFWSRFASDGGTPAGYAERLTELTGLAYRADRYLADMDADFYSADYLRAALRSAQLRSFLRREVGDAWGWHPKTGSFLRELFREGTRPSSEDIATRIGYDPLDVGPLMEELRTEAGVGSDQRDMRPA